MFFVYVILELIECCDNMLIIPLGKLPRISPCLIYFNRLIGNKVNEIEANKLCHLPESNTILL